MSPQNKRKRLRDWMYQKFSLDPKSRCMLPGPGSKRKKRNEACWFGFELTDADLEHVLRDTMETYLAAHCPSATEIGDACSCGVDSVEIDSAVPTLAVAEQHGPDDAIYMIREAFDERARELEADMLAARCSFEAALQARRGN